MDEEKKFLPVDLSGLHPDACNYVGNSKLIIIFSLIYPPPFMVILYPSILPLCIFLTFLLSR